MGLFKQGHAVWYGSVNIWRAERRMCAVLQTFCLAGGIIASPPSYKVGKLKSLTNVAICQL